MSDSSATRPSFVRWSMIYSLAIITAVVLRVLALTEVEAGTVGVRYNNALGLHKEDLAPGFHLELAGLQRVHRLPSAYLLINYTQDNTFSIRTKDNNTVHVDVSIPYRIKPGSAWRVMDAGNHLATGDGRYRFQRFAEETATSVLREHMARLRSEDFYDTDRRLEVAKAALEALNQKLEAYHLEARILLVRAAYFRDEYEVQLAQIQFNEQQKLLDGAKQAVAERQQGLDNFQQQTNAMVSAQEQDWAQRIAELDRAYQVGFIDTGDDRTPGAARRGFEAIKEAEKTLLVERAAEVFGIGKERVTDAHLLGIKNIQAETTEYRQRVAAEADGISARLSAEGAAKIATLNGAYEARINTLLNSPAGRAYVAYQVAGDIDFERTLTFRSDDGIPSVLRLGDFAKQLMGR